jgi:hypothetical protein
MSIAMLASTLRQQHSLLSQFCAARSRAVREFAQAQAVMARAEPVPYSQLTVGVIVLPYDGQLMNSVHLLHRDFNS